MGPGTIPVPAHTERLFAGRKHRHDIGAWARLLGARRATLFRRRNRHKRRVTFHDDGSWRYLTAEPRERSNSIPPKLRAHCLKVDGSRRLWSGDVYGTLQLHAVPPRGPRLGAVVPVSAGQPMARHLVYRSYNDLDGV